MGLVVYYDPSVCLLSRSFFHRQLNSNMHLSVITRPCDINILAGVKTRPDSPHFNKLTPPLTAPFFVSPPQPLALHCCNFGTNGAISK